MPVWPQCIPEICDGLDNDCDGNLDEGCDRTCDQPTRIGLETLIAGEAYGADLVWQGSEYAAIGSNTFSGGSGAETLFRRMSATGSPLGAEVSFSSRTGPSIASAGNEYAVVWRVFDSAAASFARFDPAGSLIGAETPLGDGSAYGIVWTGAGYGVAFHDAAGDQRLIRISPLGSMIGSTIIQGGGFGTDLAWSGSEYGVLTRQQDQAGTFQIHFARLDANGHKIGPTRQLSASATGISGGSLVSASGEWGAVWKEDVPGGSDIFFARVDANGHPAGAVKQVTDQATSRQPSLAWTGAEYAVSFIDWRDGHSEIYLARLDAHGDPVGSPLRVTVTQPWDSTLSPVLARGGSGYGIAYSADRFGGDPLLYFSTVGCPCQGGDPDGDGVSDCGGDCDANDGNIYPGAPEVCDGVSNDCLVEGWPRRPAADWDHDDDGITTCQGDCNDNAAAAYPGATEVCDSIDNDCDTLIDEDASGEDTDGDTVGNLCDNCLLEVNPTQSDFDLDAEGDVCDLNDGRIHIRFDARDFVDWDPEEGYDSWNAYRGDIEVLKSRGIYTQRPHGQEFAEQFCQLPRSSPFVQDTELPDAGQVGFYLTTGIAGGIESGLGTDSTGAVRPNANPCP